MLPSVVTRFLQTETGKQVIATVVVLLLAVAARAITSRLLRRNTRLRTADRLRWRATTRNLVLGVVALAVLFIWGSQLRDFLVSLVVLASAIVLATKELLMCVSGGILRATSRSFEAGDRIEVGAVRGDVIDLGLLGTTILEIGPGHQRTGRTYVIPNSVFLAQPVANETFTDRFVLHSFSLPVLGSMDWHDAEERLQTIADDVCGGATEEAKKHMDAVSSSHGLATFEVQPKITVHPEGKDLTFRVRVPSTARERGRVEQEITRRYFEVTPPAEA